MLRIMPVFGTRPEAIKMAPLIKVLEKCDEIQTITTVTAQHREMLDQVLNLFNIKPTYDLNIMAPEQTLTQITVKVLQRIESIIKKEKPDLILVHGDTSTTFVSSLAAFYHQIPVGHVEAGLRTYNKYSPYPEEMNRKLTGCMADLHFAPTRMAKDALLKEGIKQESIVITGNTVIDALLQTVNKDYVFKDDTLKKLDVHNKKIILVTAHRRENLGERMQNIFLAIKEIVENNPDIEVVLPVHLNPVVQQAVHEVLAGVERVRLISPLEYEEFVNLMDRCYLVLTDSGGLQEEAPALGKPVLVLRDTTERPEAVEAGTVKLVGTDRDKIVRETTTLITKPTEYQKMAEAVNPYGDGKAAERILQAILYHFKLTDQPAKEFGKELR
ncbi:MAG TPA: UDP-N-acetylglucosamine 2-epimerase (non-hydrolyzing) [Bacteroidales bacterium]|nr:UDP-N-acetylglucosamine 2-epimerase (non-hydrolyzing) [Bacteroidales bacterium]